MSKKEKPEENSTEPNKKKKCGIIMPISPIKDYPTEHWVELRELYIEVGQELGFDTYIVSDSKPSGVILENIIRNLFSCDIVICDVSSNNPNVLLELGVRLTSKNPTIIVKDDVTKFNFDIQIFEHLIYPQGLRYFEFLNFKNSLKEKINATYEDFKEGNYSPFLEKFKDIKVTGLETKEVNKVEYQEMMFEKILEEISRIKRTNTTSSENVQPSQTNPLNRTNLVNYFVRAISRSAQSNNIPVGISNFTDDLILKMIIEFKKNPFHVRSTSKVGVIDICTDALSMVFPNLNYNQRMQAASRIVESLFRQNIIKIRDI